jgi:hypothetical protein
MDLVTGTPKRSNHADTGPSAADASDDGTGDFDAVADANANASGLDVHRVADWPTLSALPLDRLFSPHYLSLLEMPSVRAGFCFAAFFERMAFGMPSFECGLVRCVFVCLCVCVLVCGL